MAQEVTVKELGAQPTVAIRTTTSMAEIGNAMGPLFGEVSSYLHKKGAIPAGEPFTIYHKVEADQIDMECGMPVASPTEGEGRIAAGELPGGRAATVTHLGPYDKLGDTYAVLTAWVQEKGYKPAGSMWEVYFTDPTQEPDTSKWRTDIFQPIT